MKRTELKRRTPLERKSQLRPISEKQAAKRADARAAVAEHGGEFHAAIHGERCVVCKKTAAEARAAGTRHQAHHAIRQEVLRRLGLESELWNPKLAVCVCEEPCHRRHTERHQRIRWVALPGRVIAEVFRLGLQLELEKEYR